jgi:hypothetical protein
VNFSGSYRSGEVSFLLRPLAQQAFVDVAAKEALIQDGGATTARCCRRKRRRRNATCACSTQPAAPTTIAWRAIAWSWPADRAAAPRRVALVSLARAGTPVGVVVARLLRELHGRVVAHYSVSIVRDRGIDAAALRHILAPGHAPEDRVPRRLDRQGRDRARAGLLGGRLQPEHGTAIDSGLPCCPTWPASPPAPPPARTT